MGFSIKKTFVLAALATISCVNAVSLEFSKNGVLRKEGDCNITFINFGMDKWIKNLNITKSENSLSIEGLVNGNIGPNSKIHTKETELRSIITIKQGDNDITDFEISNISETAGTMNIKINNITTCENLSLKQGFIEETVIVANRLYYYGNIPSPKINKSFARNLFGPSYNYPFERVHWKINDGLDDLRETCGIHILYYGNAPVTSNGRHWQYYLSVENANTESCDKNKFFDVIKNNFKDYHFTEELLGSNYLGYVLKREGHEEEHMDGIIDGNKYLIEMYQNSCGGQSNSRSICVIPSQDKLSFNAFTDKLIHECLKMNNVEGEWEVTNGVATGTFNDQILTVETSKVDGKGSLTNDEIIYESVASGSTPVARFVISFACKDGTFMDDKCQCKTCPANCLSCTSDEKCDICNEISTNVNNKCECIEGYEPDKYGVCGKQCVEGFIKVDGECIKQCRDNEELVGKECQCISGYVEVEGECVPECKKNEELVGKECKCIEGYAADENGICIKQCGNNEEADDDQCKCIEGYAADENGVCVKQCGKNEELEGGECVCKEGYAVTEKSNRVCVKICGENEELDENSDGDLCKCKEGYAANENGACTLLCGDKEELVEGVCQCKDSYIAEVDGNCVKKCGTNEQLNGEECQCKEGYAANENGECIKQCGENKELDGEECKCIEGYTTDENDNCVIKCGNKEVLVDGVCQCKDGYIAELDGTCVRKCSENEVADGDDCKCKEGYVADVDGTCVKKCGNNEELVDDLCQCKTGYIYSEDGICTKISPPTTTITTTIHGGDKPCCKCGCGCKIQPYFGWFRFFNWGIHYDYRKVFECDKNRNCKKFFNCGKDKQCTNFFDTCHKKGNCVKQFDKKFFNGCHKFTGCKNFFDCHRQHTFCSNLKCKEKNCKQCGCNAKTTSIKTTLIKKTTTKKTTTKKTNTKKTTTNKKTTTIKKTTTTTTTSKPTATYGGSLLDRIYYILFH
ncbi:hypothetical protein BCR32DRAFT_328635 [Anaeromyces robustus]|uniref:EGF-like domain-containing protein n=1 Tax=Anaeromyces robustus TaxID=1754192 RepID=A0A1Y1WX90_9FUNG|nr:hypothetical protein BCR32DRAFT_328635 [Anaeromyces robustus]|eukprot:ORX78161.1 hypothetical protein BCR32DRAFT_328635 [Anaeromyces robustus]